MVNKNNMKSVEVLQKSRWSYPFLMLTPAMSFLARADIRSKPDKTGFKKNIPMKRVIK